MTRLLGEVLFSETDPGPCGPGTRWMVVSTGVELVRNDQDNGWLSPAVVSIPGTLDDVLGISGGEDIADALTGAGSPSGSNPVATLADLPSPYPLSGNETDAITGAASPGSANVFATMNDLPSLSVTDGGTLVEPVTSIVFTGATVAYGGPGEADVTVAGSKPDVSGDTGSATAPPSLAIEGATGVSVAVVQAGGAGTAATATVTGPDLSDLPTDDEKAALDGAASPSVSNVFATIADLPNPAPADFTGDAGAATAPPTVAIEGAGSVSTAVVQTGGPGAAATVTITGPDVSNLPTSDEKDAMDDAATPSSANPFATIADIPAFSGPWIGTAETTDNTPLPLLRTGSPLGIPDWGRTVLCRGRVVARRSDTVVYPITVADPGTSTFHIAGDWRHEFPPFQHLRVFGSTANDGTYSVVGVTFGTDSAIVVAETFTDDTADGGIESRPVEDSAWEWEGVARGDAIGLLSWIGVSDPLPAIVAQDDAVASWAVSVSISAENIVVGVTGEAGKTIDWEGSIDLDSAITPIVH